MGLGFYLVTIFMVKDAEKLRSALLWKSIGGIALMAVSWIQYGVWLVSENYPEWMYKFQAIVSSNGMLYPARASGLAYEPSWLAHELNMIYIPIWFGLSLSGHSAFKKNYSTNPIRENPFSTGFRHIVYQFFQDRLDNHDHDGRLCSIPDDKQLD